MHYFGLCACFQPVGFITFHSKHDAEVARRELQVSACIYYIYLPKIAHCYSLSVCLSSVVCLMPWSSIVYHGRSQAGAVGAPSPSQGGEIFFRRNLQGKCVSAPPGHKLHPQPEQESIFRTVYGQVRFGGIFSRSLSATTKKSQLFGEKVHHRQNPGYAYVVYTATIANRFRCTFYIILLANFTIHIIKSLCKNTKYIREQLS